MARSPRGGKELDSKLLILSGSKGGCGRSSCARNLLVAAALDGIDVVGIDLDPQGTLSRWGERRQKAKIKLPQIVVPEITHTEVSNLVAIEAAASGHQLAIIDTAPSVEEHMRAMVSLCARAALVLIPTSPTHDDLESVAPWFLTLKQGGARTAFLLNRANRRTKSFEVARSKLLKVGPLAPLEIPALEDMHLPHVNGLAAVDYERNKAGTA
ncbi:division plane positioning ATPase MipZ, partial [Pseudoroseomonas globiformis]